MDTIKAFGLFAMRSLITVLCYSFNKIRNLRKKKYHFESPFKKSEKTVTNRLREKHRRGLSLREKEQQKHRKLRYIDAEKDEQEAEQIIHNLLNGWKEKRLNIWDKPTVFEAIVCHFSTKRDAIFQKISHEYQVSEEQYDGHKHRCCCGTECKIFYYIRNIYNNNCILIGNECVENFYEDEADEEDNEFIQDDDEPLSYEDEDSSEEDDLLINKRKSYGKKHIFYNK